VNEALSRELNYSLFYLLLFIFPIFEITSMIPHLHEKGYKLVIVGERKFHSIELAQWLHRQHHSFVLRQKCSTTFREKRQQFQSLNTIPIQPGIHRFYPKISFPQKKGFSMFNLTAYWKKNIEVNKKMNLGIC
jgi:hypothetical protein